MHSLIIFRKNAWIYSPNTAADVSQARCWSTHAMKLRSAMVLAFLALTASGVRAAAPPSASGFWEAKDDDGFTTAWFLFSEKNNVYYARLVKGFRRPDATTPIKMLCTDCPGEKKGAHIMGLTLFWGMKRDGLHYTGGSVLDPRDGSVYHAKMDLSEDGQDLSVRGYLGIEILGKTQVWHRLPDDTMKKEDIPKEILASGPVGDSAIDKPKPKKPKPIKTDTPSVDVPSPEATPDPAAK
jgi:hypothetical protein